jgi:hypothetical protein
VFCVIVELWLNSVGALTWDWPWWNARAPILIVVFGYLHFFLVSYWVHDMKTVRAKVITVGAIFGFDIVCILVFGVALGWI